MEKHIHIVKVLKLIRYPMEYLINLRSFHYMYMFFHDQVSINLLGISLINIYFFNICNDIHIPSPHYLYLRSLILKIYEKPSFVMKAIYNNF